MLPKLNTPTFQIKLISVAEPIRYRPFTVKEEKILLIAEESNEDNDILYAMRQILTNCCISELDVNKLPVFDLEYFFIQARAKSVNNISVVKYRDKEDEEVRDFTINFEELIPTIDPRHKTTFNLDDNTIVTMKYPTIETLSKIKTQDEINISIDIIAACLDKIIQGEDVYSCDTYTIEEKVNFVSSFSTSQFELITDEFLLTMPKISKTLTYTNNLGNNRTIILEGYKSFFP